MQQAGHKKTHPSYILGHHFICLQTSTFNRRHMRVMWNYRGIAGNEYTLPWKLWNYRDDQFMFVTDLAPRLCRVTLRFFESSDQT